jgi:hypothetical protein
LLNGRPSPGAELDTGTLRVEPVVSQLLRPPCRPHHRHDALRDFWVAGGRMAAPVGPMRFDDSIYRMLGENLVDLTRECSCSSIVEQLMPLEESIEPGNESEEKEMDEIRRRCERRRVRPCLP